VKTSNITRLKMPTNILAQLKTCFRMLSALNVCNVCYLSVQLLYYCHRAKAQLQFNIYIVQFIGVSGHKSVTVQFIGVPKVRKLPI
jgi:hypothetical protein